MIYRSESLARAFAFIPGVCSIGCSISFVLALLTSTGDCENSGCAFTNEDGLPYAFLSLLGSRFLLRLAKAD
jgi:hypothetical protein